MRPASVSATKISPFGATRICRGWSSLAKAVTVKPAGTLSSAPAGRATIAEGEAVGGLAKGLGISAAVIRRVTPGASVRQSPNAASPVLTWACDGKAEKAATQGHTRGKDGTQGHQAASGERNCRC